MQRQQSGGRTRAIVFLGLSVVLGLAAAVLVFRLVQTSRSELEIAVQKQKEVVDVVVAVRDLYMGLPIGPEDVIIRQMSPDMVQREGTFGVLPDVLGRTPKERILSNEPIRDERLARPDAGIGLNAIVNPGKRAMTVATNTETGVAGLLQAGNYVDIIVTIRPEDPTAAGAKWVTDTILQGIKVLAVGSNLGGNEAKEEEKKAQKGSSKSDAARRMKPSITLEVGPEEAEKLALSVSQGEIHVVLRSDIDIAQWDAHGVMTGARLIGYDGPVASGGGRPRQPAAVEDPGPAPVTATVIQGSKQNEIVFGAQPSDKKK